MIGTTEPSHSAATAAAVVNQVIGGPQRHGRISFVATQACKTRNLYLPKALAEQARGMTDTYGRLKQILRELSEINYQLLRERGLTEDRKCPEPSAVGDSVNGSEAGTVPLNLDIQVGGSAQG